MENDAYHLNCKFESVEYYSPFGRFYTCRAFDYNAHCNSRTITSVSGWHPGHQNNDNVEQLLISRQRSECLPRRAIAFFKNLRSLAVTRSYLNTLHSDDLVGLTSLRVLDVADNSIRFVPAGFFDPTPYLEIASFARNGITRFVPRILPELSRLRSFHMNRNSCINMEAWTPNELRNLQAEMIRRC